MLDEKAKRRAGFREGVGVTMADGQDWSLPRPLTQFAPSESDQGFDSFLALGDGYQELVNAYYEAEAGAETIRAEMALASRLVLTNYDLTPGELASLVRVSYDEANDPEAFDRRREILGVAMGREKKAPSGDGDESPS